MGRASRIADITLEAVPSASIAGMTMLGEDERPTTAVFTDTESPEIDDAFDGGVEETVADLTGAAASVLANVSAYSTAFELSQHPSEAMASRAVIEQAKRILMASLPPETT